MEKKVLKLSITITLIMSILALFVNYQFTLGLLCGQLCFSIYFLNLCYSIDKQLKGDAWKIWTILLKVGRIILLGIPMLFAFLWPNIFNIFGAFIGVMMFKICTIIGALK